MRFFLLTAMIVIFVSCRNNTKSVAPGLPADSLISRDRMIDLLVDVHLVEAALALRQNRRENTSMLTKDYYHWLCSRYHISMNCFRKNLDYYKSNPEDFSKMYEVVAQKLTERSKTGMQPQSPPISRKLMRK